MTDKAQTLPMTEQVPHGVRPISTAPMDGREILGYWSAGKTWAIVYCSDLNEMWCDEGGELMTPPTHWHPLPDDASLKARIQVLEEVLTAAQKEICSRPLAKGDGHEHDLWLRNKMRAALNPEKANG